MKSLIEFINESLNKIQGLESYSEEELISIIEEYCQEVIASGDIDAKILEVWLHGSRKRGTAKSNSDLDAVLFYKGDAKEDGLFNTFNDDDDHLEIDSIRVDINPVLVKYDSDIEKYKKSSDKYDADVISGKIKK